MRLVYLAPGDQSGDQFGIGLCCGVQLQGFGSIIVPKYLYSSEIWGFKNLGKKALQYSKSLLGAKKCTPNVTVLDALGSII